MCLQLSNPSAERFSQHELKQAMLDTISAINTMTRKAHIDEVGYVTHTGFSVLIYLEAKSSKLLRD
jgi:hypothetical protein